MTRKTLNWKLAAVPTALFFGVSAASAVAANAVAANSGNTNANGPHASGSNANGARTQNDDASRPPRRESPENRKMMMQAHLREQLTRAGITSAAQQTTIVDFATAQEEARRNLRDTSRALSDATLDSSVSDATLSTQLSEFRAAIAAEKTRSDKAEAALDTAIGFSGKPHLEAFLMTQGLLGDSSAYAGRAGGPDGPGGRRGGPPRGGRPGGEGLNGRPDGRRGGQNDGGQHEGGQNGGQNGDPRDENAPDGPPSPDFQNS